MIRLPLLIAAGAIATAAAVTPAVAGLSDNPSFSKQVPVRVPEHARIATFPTAGASPDGNERPGDRYGARGRKASPHRSDIEPGDDRGRGEGGSGSNQHG